MATLNRYNILIIDSDAKSRSTLKDVAMALPSFSKVLFCSSLEEGLKKTVDHDAIDVVTLSHKFSINQITDFIKDAKNSPKGSEWAFISVLKTSGQQNELIAEHMLGGVDGFLFEPYSADNLKEMAETTSRVRQRNEETRIRNALQVYLKEISSHVDAIAFYLSQGRKFVVAQKKLEGISNKLKRFSSDNPKIYQEVITDIFSNADCPPTSSYNGVSARVRERMKAKKMAELSKEYGE
ncbi:MAG TPA: hypothetical protein PKA63_10155 [Oligoflexia bacterium]|nr:hypothetical protein [Oligoflexia bacterium]HMP49019.1 hypothetical protein [Oligoflexia bacterium]